MGFFSKLFTPKILKIYHIAFNTLNEWNYQGTGEIKFIEKSRVSLYKIGSSQIIYFQMDDLENLIIQWKYKYLQEEMIYNYKIQRSAWTTENSQTMTTELRSLIDGFTAAYEAHIEKVDKLGIPENLLSQEGISAEQFQKSCDLLSGL